MTPPKLDAKTVEKIAKALGDRNRLLILQKIARQGCVGCCQMQEVVALAQPSVSHHVKVLADAGLVHADKTGRNLNLSLNREQVQALIDFLTGLKNGQTDEAARCAMPDDRPSSQHGASNV
jgi:ArsR family transcriptional regulator